MACVISHTTGLITVSFVTNKGDEVRRSLASLVALQKNVREAQRERKEKQESRKQAAGSKLSHKKKN